MIQAILRILKGFVSLPFQLLGDLGRFLGFGPGPDAIQPPNDRVDEVIQSQATDLRADLEVAPANIPEAPRQTMGQLVHAYASGTRAARDRFDVSKFDPHVAVALLTLSSSALARLALAGPEGCQRWSENRKGVVGVPLLSRPSVSRPAAEREEAAPQVQDDEHESKPSRRAA